MAIYHSVLSFSHPERSPALSYCILLHVCRPSYCYSVINATLLKIVEREQSPAKSHATSASSLRAEGECCGAQALPLSHLLCLPCSLFSLGRLERRSFASSPNTIRSSPKICACTPIKSVHGAGDSLEHKGRSSQLQHKSLSSPIISRCIARCILCPLVITF